MCQLVQADISHSPFKGTNRGIVFQKLQQPQSPPMATLSETLWSKWKKYTFESIIYMTIDTNYDESCMLCSFS